MKNIELARYPWIADGKKVYAKRPGSNETVLLGQFEDPYFADLTVRVYNSRLAVRAMRMRAVASDLDAVLQNVQKIVEAADTGFDAEYYLELSEEGKPLLADVVRFTGGKICK